MENDWVRFEVVFRDKTPPDDGRMGELIKWCQRFARLGLAPKSAGNLSFRTDRGFIITASGVELRATRLENLVEVLKVAIENGRMTVYARGRMMPSKESVLHSNIYDLGPEINAVFHTHDQLVLEYADELKLPCTEKEQPPGSYELAGEVQRVLQLKKNARYLVVRNHGVVALGATMAEAGKRAEDMNRMARRLAQKKSKDGPGTRDKTST